MVSKGSVDNAVPVVTIAHDCQVLDLPDDLFGPHDLPVDYIVTPTRVIKCDGRPQRPAGIIWSLLTTEKLDRIPILKRLRYREWKAGKNVRLEGEKEDPMDLIDEIPKEEDEEERGASGGKRGFRRGGASRRRPRRRRNEGDEKEVDGGEPNVEDNHGEAKVNGTDGENRRFSGNRRFRGGYRGGRGGFRRGGGRGGGTRRESDRDADGYDKGKERDVRRSESDGHDDGERDGGERRRPQRGGRRPFYDSNEGSVYVGSLPRSLRVSQFKSKVRERKVNPLRVLWRGSAGFAFLNFRTQQDAEEALTALEGLQVSDRSLRLEMAKSGGGGGQQRRRRPRGGSRSGGDSDGPDDDDDRRDSHPPAVHVDDGGEN